MVRHRSPVFCHRSGVPRQPPSRPAVGSASNGEDRIQPESTEGLPFNFGVYAQKSLCFRQINPQSIFIQK
jgi:hypothetical protein